MDNYFYIILGISYLLFINHFFLECLIFLNKFSMTVMKSEKGVDLITSLCHIYQTSEDETRSIMDSITKLIEDILKRKPCLASECKADSLENLNAGSLSTSIEVALGISVLAYN